MRVAVDVADGQRAGGGNGGRRVGLGEVDAGRGQNRGVVGAEDVDVDRGVGAVGAHHVEVLGVMLDRKSVVEGRGRGVGPGAVGGDREGDVAAGGGGLRHEMRVAVDVADGQRAGGGNGGRRVGLGEVDAGRGQNRGVVGAEDVDVDRGVGAVGAHHVEVLGVM